MTLSSEAPPTPELDPDIAPPTPTGPVRQRVGELIEQPPDDLESQTTELTEDERQDFTRLITVGRRTKKIIVADHPVWIQTLRSADEIRIGLYTKPYLDSQAFARSYQVAVCAAGIREVDGMPVFNSLSEITDEDEIFNKKVEVISQYYPIVITQIYEAIRNLEREYSELLIKLGKATG